jgi:hypothetical protein
VFKDCSKAILKLCIPPHNNETKPEEIAELHIRLRNFTLVLAKNDTGMVVISLTLLSTRTRIQRRPVIRKQRDPFARERRAVSAPSSHRRPPHAHGPRCWCPVSLFVSDRCSQSPSSFHSLPHFNLLASALYLPYPSPDYACSPQLSPRFLTPLSLSS